jgi:type IV pilus assembly protein PilZ
MSDPGTAGRAAAPSPARPSVLRVSFATPAALRAEYERNLVHGAIFLATEKPLDTGHPVQVMFDLTFCDGTFVISGHVVSVVLPALAKTGATPGMSVQFLESPADLKHRLEEAAGVSMVEGAADDTVERRRAERFRTRANVQIVSADRRFPAEMLDVSYNGMLAMLPGVDLPVGTALRALIDHPRSSAQLDLAGSVVNQARCDSGYMALGVQFEYSADEIDEVMAFIDDVRGFHHAQRLATVTGELSENTLDVVIETFSTISEEGTLNLTTDAETGRIAYREGQLLYALTGLVSGVKALSRMFLWTQGRFDFDPVVEPLDRNEPPRPLQSAVLEAAVQRDEISRLDLKEFQMETTFRVDEERASAASAELDELSREIVEHAGLGFPISAILDVMSESDAAIYTVLVALRDRGILAVES